MPWAKGGEVAGEQHLDKGQVQGTGAGLLMPRQERGVKAQLR